VRVPPPGSDQTTDSRFGRRINGSSTLVQKLDLGAQCIRISPKLGSVCLEKQCVFAAHPPAEPPSAGRNWAALIFDCQIPVVLARMIHHGNRAGTPDRRKTLRVRVKMSARSRDRASRNHIRNFPCGCVSGKSEIRKRRLSSDRVMYECEQGWKLAH
jgi:hypothetical protein